MILRWSYNSPSKAVVKKAKGSIMTYHEPGPIGREAEGLILYCYGKQHLFDGFKDPTVWDYPMEDVRGLVYDHTGRLISRGVKKVFNAGPTRESGEARTKIVEHPEWEPLTKVMLEKFCGYFVQMFVHNGQTRFFTKGHGNHEFETWARQLWEQGKVYGRVPPVEPGVTHWFEAVAPEDAMNHEIKYPVGLYYLGSWDSKTDTFVLNTEDYPGEVVIVQTWEETFKYQNESTKEGWFTYLVKPDGTAVAGVKQKTEIYRAAKQLKKMREKGFSSNAVLENFYLKDGRVVFNWAAVSNILGEDFADDYIAATREKIESLERSLDAAYAQAQAHVAAKRDRPNGRKELALELLSAEATKPLLPLAMALYEGKPSQVFHVINGRLLTETLSRMNISDAAIDNYQA